MPQGCGVVPEVLDFWHAVTQPAVELTGGHDDHLRAAWLAKACLDDHTTGDGVLRMGLR